ncbi:MAG TPA: asparagine synthase (glutamine-hydrolyzing) [Acidimicrobiales bacterium]|nr:asparagine synthase (glutamine-hydrolyzing) [Acidimicrobiales bacterium]
MCGIAGCYQQPDGVWLAKVMSERLAHRGPDADGLHCFNAEGVTAQLAHRRLAIIDLTSAADQPFSKDGLVLVYNGELYNYRQLRAELAGEGVGFVTASDTEVVLEAWRRWGASALRRFRGMFAFALLDEKTGQLFLARDPLGIKPLFLMRRGDGLVFSSELKGLVAALGGELRVEPSALVASVLYYWVPDQRCAIGGVEKLPPGSFAEVSPDGRVRIESYFDVAAVAAEAAEGPQADLRAVIEDSVTAHLVADVPVSSFLSGGLDSSIITVLAKRANPDVDAYTIGFRPEDQRLEAMPDDLVYARKLGARFGLTIHEIEIAPDIADLLPRIVDTLDEPIGDPAAINTFLMCAAAREAGVKVLLSGMGADELFGGYRKQLACVVAARYQALPAVLRQRVVRGAVDRLPVTAFGHGLRYARWAKRFLTFAELPEEEAFRRSYTLYDLPELVELLSPDLGAHVGDLAAEHRQIYEDNTLGDHVNRMCLADARLFLPGLNLAYTDRASMAASTEVRVPFVDPEVVRAAFSFTGHEKIAGREGKRVLKQAAKAWLPEEIIHRPKASFSAPLRAWMAHDLRPMVDEMLLSGELVSSGFLDRAALERLVSDDRSGRQDRSKQVWQLLSMELWVRNMETHGVTM